MRAREFISERELRTRDFYERYRLVNLINKLSNRIPFDTIDGNQLVINATPSEIRMLKSELKSKFPTDDPRSRAVDDVNIPKIIGGVPISKLEKTKEFGGEEKGKRLIKQTGQTGDLDRQIKNNLNGNSFISIRIDSQGKKFVNASGVVEIPGVPKADIALVDENGKKVAYISLKDGTLPKHFGQWGGITSAEYRQFKEIDQFVESIKQIVTDKKLPPGTAYGTEIVDPLLKGKACYGKNFGESEHGINNVDIILQGTPVLVKENDGTFSISGSHVWYNPEIPSGDYEPILIARYSGDRGNFGISGTRFSTYPRGGRPWRPLPDNLPPETDQPNPTPKTTAPSQPNLNPKTTTTLKGTEFTTPTSKGQFNRNVAFEVSKIPMKSK